MNIGVPGRTGHDFDNHFDEKNNKPKFLDYLKKPVSEETDRLFCTIP